MYKILFFLCLSVSLYGQADFKIAAAGKTIEFRELDRLKIEGASGSEMTVIGATKDRDVDERAVGLRKISATGLKDNTGFGLSVIEKDGKIVVEQVGSSGKNVTIRVPNSARVVVEQSTHRGSGLEISDFAGDLDVSHMYHAVRLTNVTGVVAVNTVYDDIIAVWDKAPTKEVRLHSTYSDVDVSLPATTKANLRLTTNYGDMYTDFDIQVKANMDAATDSRDGRDSDMDDYNLAGRASGGSNRPRAPRRESSSSVNGTINGGGPLISLTATYDNLYIRKK